MSPRGQWALSVHSTITKWCWGREQSPVKNLESCSELRPYSGWAKIWNLSIGLIRIIPIRVTWRDVLVIVKASCNVAIYYHIEIVAVYSSIEHSVSEHWNEL